MMFSSLGILDIPMWATMNAVTPPDRNPYLLICTFPSIATSIWIWNPVRPVLWIRISFYTTWIAGRFWAIGIPGILGWLACADSQHAGNISSQTGSRQTASCTNHSPREPIVCVRAMCRSSGCFACRHRQAELFAAWVVAYRKRGRLTAGTAALRPFFGGPIQ